MHYTVSKKLLYPAVLVLLSFPPECNAQDNRPNMIFILVDDLGWADLGIYGSDFHLTPRIDALAESGLRFSDAYAANPVCSPTRASIMTGKDPARAEINITNWIGFSQSEKRKDLALAQPRIADQLALKEITMAEAFRENGYATYFAGKWHLGETEEYWPVAQGFEENEGGWSMGRPTSYFSPYKNPRLEDGPEGEYLPFRLGHEVTGFLEAHVRDKPEQPFFIYFPMYNVHTPLQAPQFLIDRFEQRRKEKSLPAKGKFIRDSGALVRQNQSDTTYAAMVYAMDSVVGMVIDKLKALDLYENTAIFFFSDNGGLSAPWYGVTSNLPLRGSKGWIYEGGIREPLIVNYPPVTAQQAGKVINEPVISHDFYPTMLEMAGLPLKPRQHRDGKSFLPLVKGEAWHRGPLHWHSPHYSPQRGKPASAIREDNWKLICFYEDEHYELYDLATDPGEQDNLADKEPARVRKMKAKLDRHLKKIKASFPVKKKG